MPRKKARRAPRKTGRKSLYKPEYGPQAEKLCYLGATDKELAAFFEVSPRTLDGWKLRHPDFLRSLKDGKSAADGNVAASLYRRAMGFEHQAVKIFADPKTGAELIVPYTERYAPDTVACIFWLKNRRPDLWRDKQSLEHTGKDGAPLIPPAPPPDLTALSVEELRDYERITAKITVIAVTAERKALPAGEDPE